jgi:tetratricopeptide (TPR) repeat protein
VILAPTSSLLPLPTEIGTERRMYLPLMALVALVIHGGYRLMTVLAERFRFSPRAAGYTAAAVVGVLAAAEFNRTLARNEDYKNPVALWADNLRQQPDNGRAWDNLGREFLAEQNYNAARECYLKSLALDPGNFRALNNLGSLALREGNEDEAARYLRAAIAVRPDAAAARANLALIHRKRGELDEAERLVRDAIKLQAAGPAPHLVLADVLSARRQFAAAEESARAALGIDPGSAAARVTLGTALAGRGRDAEAVAAFRDAFRLGPSHETRLHLAWQLAAADDASVRNPKEAIELASSAAEDTGRTDPYSLDVLALAFAADGRFADAVETATRAHGLAKAKQLPRAAFIDARRKAYAAGAMPNRELRDFGQ